MNEKTSNSISELNAQLNYGTWRYQKNWKPVHVVDAEGCWFTSSEGRRYLDFSSQLMCVSLGHKNAKVIAAIQEQARQLPYIAPGFASTARAELSRLLLEVLPKGLDKFFFTTSGTEANEAAFKIARLYTGKSKIISRYCSYHGSTLGSIAATGDFRRWYMEPATKIPNVIFAPEVNCYRCPLKHTYPDCAVACVEYIAHMLENEQDVAAIIIEPVVGTNGVLVPPKEYLPRLREICDQYNVLLIADEVMSGWLRTGKWFAVDHWNVVPDILTTAKGITSGYVPLGLCATSGKIAEYFQDHYFAHGHTYEAHPMTLAPAVATIEEYRRLDLMEHVADAGSYLEASLKQLYSDHKSVGEVRGIGLFWSIDLTRNRETRAPFHTYRDKYSNAPLLIDRLTAEMMKKNVYVMGWVNHFIIAPPLIINREEIDHGIEALNEVLQIADQEAE